MSWSEYKIVIVSIDTVEIATWRHTDQERVHISVAPLAGEALLVIHLNIGWCMWEGLFIIKYFILDSQFLSLIHSSSTARTALQNRNEVAYPKM